MGKHRAPELTVHPDAAGDTSPQKFTATLAPDFGADLNDDGALHQFTAAELVRLAEKLTGAAVAAAYEAGRRSVRAGTEAGPIERASQTGASCCTESNDDWMCTRAAGHPGQHVAHDFTGQIVGRWGGAAAERAGYEAVRLEATSAFQDVLDELAQAHARLAREHEAS
jgi:hypothetical protein